MIRFLLTAALLFPVSAIAKTWVDVECHRVLISSADTGQFYFQIGESKVITCEVANWPANTPVASMECSNGLLLMKMEVKDDRTLYWNGVMMNVYDGPLPCGSNGAEWPD